VVAAGACNQGGPLADPVDFGNDAPAFGDGGEMDLTVGDMTQKTCGQVVSCTVQCGLTNLTCDQMCVQGASPTALQQAGTLVLCAAQSCLLGQPDGGGGMAAIFQCLPQNCGTQVAGCDGLLSGFGL